MVARGEAVCGHGARERREVVRGQIVAVAAAAADALFLSLFLAPLLFFHAFFLNLFFEYRLQERLQAYQRDDFHARPLQRAARRGCGVARRRTDADFLDVAPDQALDDVAAHVARCAEQQNGLRRHRCRHWGRKM